MEENYITIRSDLIGPYIEQAMNACQVVFEKVRDKFIADFNEEVVLSSKKSLFSRIRPNFNLSAPVNDKLINKDNYMRYDYEAEVWGISEQYKRLQSLHKMTNQFNGAVPHAYQVSIKEKDVSLIYRYL